MREMRDAVHEKNLQTIAAKLNHSFLLRDAYENIVKDFKKCLLLRRQVLTEESTSENSTDTTAGNNMRLLSRKRNTDIVALINSIQAKIDELSRSFKKNNTKQRNSFPKTTLFFDANSSHNSSSSEPQPAQNHFMNAIPADVLRYIFNKYFNLNELEELRLVCTRWNEVISNIKINGGLISLEILGELVAIRIPPKSDRVNFKDRFALASPVVTTHEAAITQAIKITTNHKIDDWNARITLINRYLRLLLLTAAWIAGIYFYFCKTESEDDKQRNKIFIPALTLLTALLFCKTYYLNFIQDEMPRNFTADILIEMMLKLTDPIMPHQDPIDTIATSCITGLSLFKDNKIDRDSQRYFAKMRAMASEKMNVDTTPLIDGPVNRNNELRPRAPLR